MKISALSVTFDSNTLENVIDPKRNQAQSFQEDYLIIHKAIKEGKLHGFFSDTWITLEGIERKNRCRILGSRQLVSSTESSNKSDKSLVEITINMGAKMEQNLLNTKHEIPKNKALYLGLRALSGSRKLGDNFLVKDSCGKFYADIPIKKLIEHHEKVIEVEISIAKRCLDTGVNVGRCSALKLGLEYLEREQLSNCLWYEGLRFAKDKKEQAKVMNAVAEWADGENIVRHIGYGVNIFCTLDKAKNSGVSILDAEHRQWLSEEYGVNFCTPSELATKFLQCPNAPAWEL